MLLLDANSLLAEARSRIGPYCVKECRAFCCRNGQLPLTVKQKVFFSEKKKSSFVLLHQEDFLLLAPRCPFLKRNKCSIYAHELRPNACADYPLLHLGNTIIASSACPYVAKGCCDDIFAKLRELGFVVHV